MRWHKITLRGTEEHRSLLDAMADAWRDDPMAVPVEVRLYGDVTGQLVWHLNEGALDLYKRCAGSGSRSIEATVEVVSGIKLGSVMFERQPVTALPGASRMNIETGARLRENWKAKGSPPCDHPEVSMEHVDRGKTTGAYICTTCGSIVTDIHGRKAAGGGGVYL